MQEFILQSLQLTAVHPNLFHKKFLVRAVIGIYVVKACRDDLRYDPEDGLNACLQLSAAETWGRSFRFEINMGTETKVRAKGKARAKHGDGNKRTVPIASLVICEQFLKTEPGEKKHRKIKFCRFY